jgi:PAS domain S-box-containing protein
VRVPESDLELRAFIADAPIGLKWVDPGGRIAWANRAELTLFGCDESEYLGREIGEFLIDPEVGARLLVSVSRGEDIDSFRTRIRARDGSVRHVMIDGRGLFRDGRLAYSRLMTRDVTSLVEEEESAMRRVEATSHLKDEFLDVLSHELRTPVGSILIWLGLLKQGGFSPEGEARALDIVERSAKALERIVEDLLHGSRIAAGGLTLDPHRVDMSSVLRSALDAAIADADQKGVTVLTPLSDPPIWVDADAGRLQQAISNLLANAIKFTPRGGSVSVSLEAKASQAILSVVDTGEGMTTAFLPFAFDRSRQQDTTSTRAHHGLGLGLYVVRHVIEKHGGEVSAESEGAGRGSTFTVRLPLASPAALDSPALQAVEPEPLFQRTLPDGLTVLIVDDEEDVREALRLILQQNGLRVTTAASVGEGFDLLVRTRPDVLVSDIGMPGEDGLSFIRRVRQLPPSRGGLTSAAALSAYASADDKRRALVAGFQDHIAKPVDPARLIGVIANLARSDERLGAA